MFFFKNNGSINWKVMLVAVVAAVAFYGSLIWIAAFALRYALS